ncbi:MAG: hypothetical protein AVO38_01495 [delta proteobacterium ML8_D]|jgi:glycosyltransferase involved in cell wall biosynthesis|nr:MAG: hypothetical protein AVO38_01495 [delta proteobacterium ML8_D]
MQVSCIIPTRNRRDMVITAIESALAQDEYQPEIVVVNDGSTDGTERSILKRFPQVKLVSTPGLGPGLARNEGAVAAGGDVLMFLDSDDKWLPFHVKSLIQMLQKGFHVAYGVTMTRDLLLQKEFFIPEVGEEVSGDCFKSLTKWCFMVPSSVAVTRSAFESVGGFGQGRIGEDWVFFLKLSCRYPFGFVPKVISHRILHGGSLCCLQNGCMEIQKALRRIMEFLQTSGKAKPEDLDRIERMQLFTFEGRHRWRTVQEWYTSMKMQGLV